MTVPRDDATAPDDDAAAPATDAAVPDDAAVPPPPVEGPHPPGLPPLHDPDGSYAPPVPHEAAEPVAPSVAAHAPGSLGHLLGRFDAEVDRWFDHLRGIPVADRAFYSASTLGDWSLVWHLLGTAQATVDPEHGTRRAVRAAAALAVESALVNGVVKTWFRRERPVHDHERPHNLRTPATSSFPSGHASAAFLAATLLSERSRLGPVWFAVATVVATSRVHVRIHHASDVVGGAVIGVALGAAVRRAVPLRTPRR
ncbi:MAG TPA: phosphatase PAP2 family protein [Acidimicrobiales bacterium]|nr:phosphatase PAP2 family protein [Acidimicrobiales bacterium]